MNFGWKDLRNKPLIDVAPIKLTHKSHSPPNSPNYDLSPTLHDPLPSTKHDYNFFIGGCSSCGGNIWKENTTPILTCLIVFWFLKIVLQFYFKKLFLIRIIK